jgi:hypothetical protein
MGCEDPDGRIVRLYVEDETHEWTDHPDVDEYCKYIWALNFILVFGQYASPRLLTLLPLQPKAVRPAPIPPKVSCRQFTDSPVLLGLGIVEADPNA